MNNALTYFKSFLTDNKFFNVEFCTWTFVMLTIPFTTFFMWPAAVVLIFTFYLENNWTEKWINFKENLGLPYGLFLISIFLIPILGFINSENTSVALATFECYLWFLFGPLFLMTTSGKLLNAKRINALITIFVGSVSANVLFLFIRGISLSIINHDTIYLYYSHFSVLRHPTYATLYATFAFFLILNYLIKYGKGKISSLNIVLYFIELILTFGIFCLYSRSGILIFFFLLLVWGIYFVVKYPKQWKTLIVFFVVVSGTFTILMKSDIMPVNRFAKTKYSIDEKEAGNSEKSESRLAIWKTSIDCIRENMPFGVGTGDAFDAIKEKAVENGYDNIARKHYSSHNQYLQALLTNGIFGFVILVMFFSVPFITSLKFKDIQIFTIFVLLSANCLTECMFEIRSGVDFFAVMIPLSILKANIQRYETQ